MKRNDYRLHCTLAVTLATLSMASASRVNASAFFSGEQSLTAHQFIWATLIVPANSGNWTIETRNTTPGGDPVMQLFDANTLQPIPWVYNDDGAGFPNASITISGGPNLVTYRILVRSYATGSAGRTDLFVNGGRMLTQATFGGFRSDITWNAGQQLLVTGTQRGASNDTMVFLIDAQPFGGGNTIGAVAVDDDSGVKLYSQAIPSSASSASSKVIFGLYPNSTGSAHLVKQDNPWQLICDPTFNQCYVACGVSDADGDCVNDQLEPLVGTLNNDIDSDNDHIPDGFEMFGSEGWSLSEGGNNPIRGNVYVEVDSMVGSGTGQNKTPYANLAADVANIFNIDGNKRADVIVDPSTIPYNSVITFQSCSGITDCVKFSDVKTANFGGGDSIKLAFFHYAVLANRHTTAANCSAGNAEMLGNDVIVSLSSTAPCNSPFSILQQRGAFVHELGHNLNLLHGPNDENGRNDGQNGIAHKSVMNYRYTLTGIDNQTGIFVDSYSKGNFACASCSSSPKKACADLRSQNNCNSVAGSYCDCDVAEWSHLDLDYSENPGTFKDGDILPGTEDPAATSRRRANLSGKDLDVRPDSRPVSVESDQTRRKRLAERVKRWEASGRQRGAQFDVSDDGLHVYARD